MNNISWKQSFVGTKIIVSNYAYREIVKYRAVAVVVDVRRPNKVKPIYKKKRFVRRIPLAYMVKGVGLIVAPEIYAAMQKKMSQDILDEERRVLAGILGVPERRVESTLSWSHIEEAMDKIKRITPKGD